MLDALLKWLAREPSTVNSSTGQIFNWLRRTKPSGGKAWKSRKYHTPERTPIDQLPKPQPTRQLMRAALRKQTYAHFGPGTHTRPLYDEPRATLRSMARALATRRWREMKAEEAKK
jgi:hypothetical protein